jgi:hypothetical protein
MVSKTIVAQVTVGSNPTPSATRKGEPVSKRRARRRLANLAVPAIAAALLAATVPGAGAAPSDDAIERKAVLRTSDFPSGWAKSARPDPTESGLDVCAGIEGINADLVPQSARSPQFIRPDTDNVLATSSVVVLKSAKQARGYLEPYREPDAVRCLETLTESSLTDGGFTAVGVYVTPAATVPSGADDAVAFGIEITVTAPATAGRPAQTAVIYQDLLVVRVGRALANFGFLNPARPLPEAGELVDAVIGRLQGSLG